MAIDTSVPRSRRAILAAAIGGLAASAAQALNPGRAAATDGQPLIQGVDNVGSASTLVRSNAPTAALQGLADAMTGSAYGVRGRSNSNFGAGVVGQVGAASGTNYGVRGLAASTSGFGVHGEGPGTGVQGVATAASLGVGVRGKATGLHGNGIEGTSEETSGAGTGVVGYSFGATGRGVSGYGAGTGACIGVQGVTESATGVGVKGIHAIGTAVLGQGGNLGVLGTCDASGPSIGVQGQVHTSALGIGVVGRSDVAASTALGVLGRALTGTGVYGWVGLSGPFPPATKTGVYGRCDTDSTARGVSGSSGTGTGVYGTTGSGTGLYGKASSSSGAALKVSGKAVFSRSGKAIVATGNSTKTVSSVALTTASLVLATIQGAGASGVYVRNVLLNVAGSSFQIRLSKAVAANTTVAWFVVN